MDEVAATSAARAEVAISAAYIEIAMRIEDEIARATCTELGAPGQRGVQQTRLLERVIPEKPPMLAQRDWEARHQE